MAHFPRSPSPIRRRRVRSTWRLNLARDVDADLVLANDPDADRLASAVPMAGEWRLLSGNELGSLLGDYVLRYWRYPEPPIVVNSIVSSPMLGRIAARRGAVHEATLTGFKWIINAGLALEGKGEGRFAFGYEEALGYSVGQTVRDKDGLECRCRHGRSRRRGNSRRAKRARSAPRPVGRSRFVGQCPALDRQGRSGGTGGAVGGRRSTRERPSFQRARHRSDRDDRLSARRGGAADVAGEAGPDRVVVGRLGQGAGQTERHRAQAQDLRRPLAAPSTPTTMPPTKASWPTRSHWRRQWGSGSRCDRLVSAVIAGDARGRDTASPLHGSPPRAVGSRVTSG